MLRGRYPGFAGLELELGVLGMAKSIVWLVQIYSISKLRMIVADLEQISTSHVISGRSRVSAETVCLIRRYWYFCT